MLNVIAAIVAITLSFAVGRFIERPGVDNDRDVHRLAQALTWWIIVNTEYSDYIEPPNIRFVPQSVLDASAEPALKTVATVGGTYGSGVINLVDNTQINKVILLHELVHHLQHRFKPTMRPCEMELEAYTIHMRYAAATGHKVTYPFNIMAMYRKQCGM